MILIIENDPAVREFLLRALASKGHPAVAAATGPEAEALAQQQQQPVAGKAGAQICALKLVLLDLHLGAPPEGDTLIRLLRISGKVRCPIVAMSGDSQALAQLQHADHFLLKPIAVDQLYDLAEEYQ